MTGELVPTGTASQIIAEGRALVRAIAAMNASAPTGHLARRKTRLLQVEYRHRLREIIRVAPAWIAEEILGTAELVGDDKAEE